MTKLVHKFISDFNAEADEDKRMRILAEFVNIYYDADMPAVNDLLQKELERSVNKKDVNAEALVRFMLAYSAMESADFVRGQSEMKKVMDMFHLVTNHSVRAQVLNFLAFMHSHQGNFDKAFSTCYDCIREAELSNDKRNSYWGIYTLAVLHFDLKDFENAEKCYRDAAEKFRAGGNEYGQARSENGLSSIYIQQEKYAEAREILERTLKFYTSIEVTSGQSRSLNDLGLVYRKTGEIEKALQCLKESLQIRKETKHFQGIATSLNEISELLLGQKKYEEAKKYLEEAKAACEKVQNKSKLFRTHFLFSQLYRAINEPWKALDHYVEYDKIKSEVQGEVANNKIKELQTKMATEKSEKETEIHRLKNVELKEAYEEIEIKQKEIIDSINYAKRIQRSLLPNEKYIEKNLKRLKKSNDV